MRKREKVMTRLKITRRDALKAGGVAAIGAALPAPAQGNVPGQMEAAIRSVLGAAKIQKG